MGSGTVPQGARGLIARLDVIRHPSPNFGPRRDGARPDMIVLHYTAMDGAQAALERLCDTRSEVSAHYLIGSDGTVWHLVDEDMRACHAGAVHWGDVTDVNSRSIGIELDNLGTHPFSEAQMRALEALLEDVMACWSIPAERVIGHSDMAPDRKQDPGPRFDWRRLAVQGLAVWPGAKPRGSEERPRDFWTEAHLRDFAGALRRFGYPVPPGGLAPLVMLDAFRARFAGLRDGPAILAAAQDLATRFPVDRDGPNT